MGNSFNNYMKTQVLFPKILFHSDCGKFEFCTKLAKIKNKNTAV